jgi:cyanophycin synthetase
VTFFAHDAGLPMALHRAQGSAWCSSTAPDRGAEGDTECASRWRTSRSRATARSASRSRTRWRRSPPPGRWASTGRIRRALATFVNDAATAPGRFNVFDYKGATLIADYGHNPDAIQALCRP